MAENSSTRIALATFSRAFRRRFGSTDVDEILSKIDRDASSFIHVVHTGATVCARVLDHFGLPQLLAEHIDGGTALELDTSSDRYVFKRFRCVEEANGASAGREPTKPGVLIRGSETDRLTEGSGSIVVGDRFVLLFENAPSRMLAAAVETVLDRERDLLRHARLDGGHSRDRLDAGGERLGRALEGREHVREPLPVVVRVARPEERGVSALERDVARDPAREDERDGEHLGLEVAHVAQELAIERPQPHGITTAGRAAAPGGRSRARSESGRRRG